MFRTIIYLFVISLFSCFSFNGYATRIKDVGEFDGVNRINLLVGYGLVVGLNGTGDNLNNNVFTSKGLTDFLERLGVNVHGSQLKSKNIAAVTVTAEFPAFARAGSRIDVKVSALGDATSLRNGTLIASPLLGADGNVYAVSQGSVLIPEFEPVSESVKTKRSPKIETNGYIQNGAIVENEIGFDLKSLDQIRFALYNPDFATSVAIANAINDNIPGNTAMAMDPGTIQLTIPNYKRDEIVEFIAEIEALDVPTDYKAKIVINENNGTIVIGDNVRIRPAAVAQGNLVVNVSQDKSKASNDETQAGPSDKDRGSKIELMPANTTLSELVDALNKLGVWPRDIINILYALKAAGALDAVIEVR